MSKRGYIINSPNSIKRLKKKRNIFLNFFLIKIKLDYLDLFN